MRNISIGIIALVFSWLPVTAQAVLIQYDLEVYASMYNNSTFGELTRTFYGTATVDFDGQTILGNDYEAFSLPMLFAFDVDGTTLSGSGVIDFYSHDTAISLSLDDGPLSVASHDYIHNQTVYAQNGDYLYNELILPMDTGMITQFVDSSDTGMRSILDNVAIDSTWDRDDLFMDTAGIRLFNGTEISSVPQPAIIWLVGGGLLGLIGAARRKV